MSRRARRQHLVAGLGCLALAIGFAVLAVVQESDDAGSRWTLVIVGLILAAFALHILLAPAKAQVTLQREVMDIETLYRKRRISRADVSGYRLHPGQGKLPVIRVILRGEASESVLLPDFLDLDPGFYQWFDGVDSLDEQARQASLNAMLASPGLSGTPEEKLAALRKAHGIARWLNWISIGVFFWLVAYPHPYGWAIALAALLPATPVWLAATQGTLYKLDRQDHDVAPNLLGALFFPGIGLAIRAVNDVQLVDELDALWLTLAGAALLVFLLWWFVDELRDRYATLAWMGFLMSAYAYGALSLANVHFGRRPPVTHEVEVLDMRAEGDQGDSNRLIVGPWGTRSESHAIVVEREFFDRTRKGSTVCVYEWRGSLAVRWFRVSDCARD